MDDPLEERVAAALAAAGIRFTREDRNAGRPHQSGDVFLDFHLVDFDVYVEVKAFHADRIARQMATAKNVIALQGRAAVNLFAEIIRRSGKPEMQEATP